MVAVICGALLGVLCQSFSYLPDDGAYAYVATRINAGDVLHRDVQDVHAGYINFANALALRWFGGDLLAMRAPLVLLGALQAALIFMLLRRRSQIAAVAAATTFACLTFVQFLNPTANWYALAGVVLIITWLHNTDRATRGRYLVLGLLIGLVALIRQLSGVIAAVGAASVLICEYRGDAQRPRQWLAPTGYGALVAVLLFYTLGRTGLASFVLYAAWPFVVAVWLTWRTRMQNATALRIVRDVVAGGALSAVPLLAYHGAHGSLRIWFDDVVMRALSLSGADFVDDYALADYVSLSIEQIATLSASGVLNGFFWLVILCAPAILGVSALRRLLRDDELPSAPLVLMALWWSLVSVHYQIPLYLFYSVALTLAAVLALSDHGNRTRVYALSSGIGVLSAIGLYFHAAQPVRSIDATIAGVRVAEQVDCALPRLGVRLLAADCARYQRRLALIEQYSDVDDTLLAVPVNPELYFLSGRRAAVRFFNSSLGLATQTELDTVIQSLAKKPPAVVFFDPADKYNDANSLALMRWVRDHFEFLTSDDGVEVFVFMSAAENRPVNTESSTP
ncbi:MAG: hypothetical protein AB8G17_18875 [Gammaproteobacteria bacterium]